MASDEVPYSRTADSILLFPSGPMPLLVTVCSPRILRLRLGTPALGASYLEERVWPATPFDLVPGPTLVIDTGQVSLEIASDAITFRGQGGARRLRLALTDIILAPRLRLPLVTAGEQHFYGLGGSGEPFDRLGVTRRLWNSHINHGPGADMAIPLLMSNKGYGLFFDNSCEAYLDAGASNDDTFVNYRSEAQALDLYYLGGGTMRETLREVALLLGQAPMPPRWALGYLQSTRHFEDTRELRNLPRLMREKQLPCDALILLSTYADFRGWNRGVGHLECEPDLISHPEELFAEFRGQHFHIITHEYPVVHEASPLHAEAKAKGYLLTSGYPRLSPPRPSSNYREGQRHIDFSNPAARHWWWQAHRHLVECGVDGWWLDGGEGPAPDTELAGGRGASLHNRFDLLRQQAFFEGEAEDRPDGRPFLHCRSGGPGMQRFGAACWSGDINNTFTTLEAQLGVGLNVGLSGVPYWNTDVGGFYAAAPETAELFVRWFQFGAFCPIFRAHGRNWRKHLPWAYGPKIEAICRDAIGWRYRLMPYTYTLCHQAHREGLPLMRPLILNYPDDPRAFDMANQYLFGDDLLVAPVTREGATQWSVYLPDGIWHDFWTHEAYAGGTAIAVAAPLERMPLFARAGALIPLGPVLQHEGERELTEITVLTYPGEDGTSSFSLYEDDGATNAYRRGGYALTELTCCVEGGARAANGSSRIVTCGIGALQGDAEVVPRARSYAFQVYAPAPPRSVEIDGVAVAQGAGSRGAAGAHPSWFNEGSFVFVNGVRQGGSARLSF